MNKRAIYAVYDLNDNELCVCVGDKYDIGKYLEIEPNQVKSRAYHYEHGKTGGNYSTSGYGVRRVEIENDT